MAGDQITWIMDSLQDEPSTIDDFDDSDCPTESPESSHHPVALESRIPNHLLLVSLLESLVEAYEKEPTRRRKMFRIICKHLDDMNVIPSWNFIENFSAIRAQYSSIVQNMMVAITKMMDNQIPSKFLSLPSTAEERSQALLGFGDPLSPRTPDIRTEDVIKGHNSRYKTEFKESERIGKGGFGSVYKVKNRLDQREYAVKKIRLKQKHPESARKVLREVQLLASLDHANIVGYNAAWIEAEPVHNPKAKIWSLPMDDPMLRHKHRPEVRYSRSNSDGGEHQSPPDPITKPVIQSPPSNASTITATPKRVSNVHMRQTPSPLSTESGAHHTPQTVVKAPPETSYNPARYFTGHNFAMAGRIDLNANAFSSSSRLTEIDESECVEIERTGYVETSGQNSGSSDLSKSMDSFEKLLSNHTVDDYQSVSRTSTKDEPMDKVSNHWHSTCNQEELDMKITETTSYEKYDADSEYSDLSIHFEDSTHLDSLPSSLRTTEHYSSLVQSEKLEFKQVSKRHVTETSFKMETSTEIKNSHSHDKIGMEVCQRRPDGLVGNISSSDAFLLGQFGYNLARKSTRERLKDVPTYYDCKDSPPQPLLNSDIDGKLDLAEKRKVRSRRAVSFDPVSDLSRSEADGGSQAGNNLFPGFVVTLFIQMQLCSRTLADWLKERNDGAVSLPDAFDGVNVPNNMQILEDIMKGVQYIHSNGFMHRDLKPKNIFLEGEDLHVRIGDFGLARPDVVERSRSPYQDYPLTPFDEVPDKWDFTSGGSVHTSGVGTATYASPEQLKGSDYDSKSDMYSAGIILFELFHPFSTGMERGKCLVDLRQGRIAAEVVRRWPLQSAMIETLVAVNSTDRPSADEVLQSELFVSKDEMISTLQTQLSEQSKLLSNKQRELREKTVQLREARQKLKEKDAIIYELLNRR